MDSFFYFFIDAFKRVVIRPNLLAPIIWSQIPKSFIYPFSKCNHNLFFIEKIISSMSEASWARPSAYCNVAKLRKVTNFI